MSELGMALRLRSASHWRSSENIARKRTIALTSLYTEKGSERRGRPQICAKIVTFTINEILRGISVGSNDFKVATISAARRTARATGGP